MPIEKRPQSPLPRNYTPPGGIPYKVKTNDDWYSVAKANGIAALDLVYFNFRTRNPAEVNFYLRANVGCTKHTPDQKNWMFSAEASPGLIYLPPKVGWQRPPAPPPGPPVPVPGTEPRLVAAKQASSGVWFGLGGQTGGHLVIGGKETVEACLYSLEGYENRFWMNIDGYRLGPGLGASAGLVFVVATGGVKPGSFSGVKVNGFDFQASLGGKWGDLAKGLKGLGAVARFALAGKIVDKAVSLAEWEKVRDLVLGAIKAGSIDPKSSKPEVNVMAIPGAGVGLELSAFYTWGKVLVHRETRAR